MGTRNKKSKRRTTRVISRKSVLKTSHSCKDFFDKVPNLERISSSYTQNVFPFTSLDENSIEFKVDTDRYLYLETRETHLKLKLQLFKGRLFDAFKKKTEHKQKSQDDSDEKPQA